MAEDISTLVMVVKSDGIKQGASDLDKLKKAADGAEQAVKKLATSVIQTNSQFTTGTGTAQAMLLAIEKLAISMNILATQQTRTTRTTIQNNEAMREAHALARGLSGSFGALWLTYGNFAGMAVGLAMGASLKGIVTVGKDVEHTLEKIRVLGETTVTEVNQLRDAVYELGQGVNGPKDVAEALSVLTMAGLSAKDALKGVGASLNLAIAGDVSIEKSASTLVQVGTALGYTADGFDHIGDVIAKTAAVSMSSVDSIAGAFKSAAAVGEVYGASLQDIGLGLAAVANLGIQGTAAGTALKNFYKDLSSGAEKTAHAFEKMGIAGKDLKDQAGNFLPLVEVIQKLDTGFSTLAEGQRQLAMQTVFGERGIKEGAALIRMLHTVSEEVDANGKLYANKLIEVNDRINKSYAFSTLAAIAMAQTTNNQLKSVGNTLQTSFAKAFTDIQPQINDVARALKAAFSSPEFIEGIKTLAMLVADATRFVAEHIKAVTIAAALYASWKVGAFATGLVTVAQGFSLATIGARAFTLALGPIAVAIAAMGAAWAIYNANKDKSITNNSAAKSLNEFNDGVVKAAEKEQEILDMRKKGISETDILRKQQMDTDKEASALAIAQSEKGIKVMKDALAKKWDAMSSYEKKRVQDAQAKGVKAGFEGLDDYMTSLQDLKHAEEQHTTQVNVAKTALDSLTKSRKANADAMDAAAKAARIKEHGDTDLGGDPTKGAISAAYAAAIKEQDNIIKKANRTFQDEEDRANEDFAAGRIGRLQLIKDLAAKELVATNTIRAAEDKKIGLASRGTNKDADLERFTGEREANEERSAQSSVMREKLTATEIARVQQESAKFRVKTLEDQGHYEQAAQLKFTGENAIMFQRATEDALEYGAVYPELWKKVEDFTKQAQQAVFSGKFKDALNEFALAAEHTGTVIAGIQTATEGSGPAVMWEAATAASKQYSIELEDLKVKQIALAELANSPAGSDEDKVKAVEALKTITSLAEKHKTMWTGIGTSIGSSLEKAFGKGGKALGDMVKAHIAYSKLSDKSASAQIGYYGDMAEGAKGFFSENSKGYKLLDGVTKAFHIAQLAMNIKSMVSGVAAGAAQMFAQSGWGGFAGVAAMGAVMAGLGYSIMSSTNNSGQTAEEVQKTQGAGSVFGDSNAKSESISKSLEYLESNSDIMLPLTQGMLASLRNIEANMNGLTNIILRTDGVTDGSNLGVQTGVLGTKSAPGTFGLNAKSGAAIGTVLLGPILGGLVGGIVGKIASLWGKTTQDIVDSGLQYGGKVSNLQAGQGYNQYASVNTTKSSWFGLSKSTSNSVQTQGLSSELSNQFGLLFTNLEDTMKMAAPALGKSAIDVGNAINNLVITTTKLSLKGLTGQALQDAVNAVISKTMDEIATAAFPSLSEFRKVGEGYAQTVIRVASGVEQANVAMEALGLTAINYTQIINKQGDVALEMARQTIAAKEGMNGVNDMLKGFGSTIGELVEAYKSLIAIRDQMNAVGLNGGGLNVNVVKGAGGVTELGSALKNYQDKYFTDGEKAAIMLKSVTAEFAKLGLGLPANNAALRKLIESTGVGTEANSKLTGKLLVLADAYDDLTQASDKAREAQTSQLKASIADFQRFIEQIKEFRKSLLLGSLSTLKPEEKFAEAKAQYEDTLSKALNGDTVAQGKVTSTASAYLEASKIVNASSDAYGQTFSQVQNDLMGLESYVGTQLTEAQKQLAALDAQVNGINTLNNTALAILDALAAPLPIASVTPAGQATDGGNGPAPTQAMIDAINAAAALNAQKMDDLYAVVYDSQNKNAQDIVNGTGEVMENTAWTFKQGGTKQIVER